MAIFKLQKDGNDISNAELIEASKTNIDLELHLESWLEKSPWAIAQEPLIWIGRQTTASCDDTTIFPDLLGIDKDGNIVVVELKRGRTERFRISRRCPRCGRRSASTAALPRRIPLWRRRPWLARRS